MTHTHSRTERMTTSQAPRPTDLRPSRRALLTAAWSMPAVIAVTASPAYATSGGGATPAATQLTALEPQARITSDPGTPSLRTITGSIRVDNPTDTVTQGLQVTFTMAAAYLPADTPSLSVTGTHGAWTMTGGAVTGSNLTATLTAQTQLPARTSAEIRFTVRATMPQLPPQAPAVQVRPSATNLALSNWVTFTPVPS